jgi:hypothetical protein
VLLKGYRGVTRQSHTLVEYINSSASVQDKLLSDRQSRSVGTSQAEMAAITARLCSIVSKNDRDDEGSQLLGETTSNDGMMQDLDSLLEGRVKEPDDVR